MTNMIKALIVVVCIQWANSDELQELLAQQFAREITSPSPTVSGVAQFYTSDSSNFTEVTESDFFVDKTLLIKELMDNTVPPFLEISAAPHFGKSTNLDMIKRFLEINVDERGRRVLSESTVNYKTFTRNSLQIAKQKKTFEEHFGKHPVLSIDYKPFETVTKFDFLLKKCREVLFKTFSQYKYLLQSEHFLRNENNVTDIFVKYVYEKTNVNLNEKEIEEGFLVLSNILYNYFKAPVVVLIDDYDVIVDAPVSEYCRDDVYGFIVNMTNRIVESTVVNRVILTGSLHRGGIPYSPKIKSALETTPRLLTYYGLSKNELNTLLFRFLKNSTEVEYAIDCIIKDYSGYVRSFEVYDEMTTNPMNEVVCSVWSVIQYLTCVRKINIGIIGDPLFDGLSISYMSIKDRGRLIKTF